MAGSNLPVVVSPIGAPAAPPRLVWANGRPMNVDYAQLVHDVAGPEAMSSRSINAGHPSQGLTPAGLAQLLIAAEQGDMIAYLELAEEIEEKEWQYASVLGTRKRAVAQLPIEVEAAGDDVEAMADADFIRTWLKRDTLEMELVDILDAVGKGFSVTEIVWETTASTWLPARLETRDPRWFRFDPIDGRTLQLVTQGGYADLAPYKYIEHVHPNKTGLPIRGGLARPAAWAWMFKNFALKQWLSFIEVFGLPLRIGKYDNGESEENIRLLMRAIHSLGSDASAVFPKTMDVVFEDGKGAGKGGDAGVLFKSLVEYVDQQLSKLVLGQTATTDAIAGGHAVGKVHNEVRADIERADAKLLAATLNRDLVRPMIELNRGQRAAYPRLKIGRPEAVDVAAMATALQILVPLGLKVSEQTVRQRAGFPDPKTGEAVLVAPAGKPPVAPIAGDEATEAAETASARLLGPLKASYERRRPASSVALLPAPADVIDLTVDEAMGDWLRVVEPVVDPIAALADSAADLDAFRRGLAGLVDQLGVDAIVEQLARATFAARIAAMADDEGN